MKVIYESPECYLREDNGTLFFWMHAWGANAASTTISTATWVKLVQAWLESQGADMERHGHARLKRFIESAKGLAVYLEPPNGSPNPVRFVSLSDVRNLLVSLHEGKEPDYRPPPAWAGKDVTGYLMQRGWKITQDAAGLHRRGFFIPGDIIQTAKGGESTADVLEIEGSVRTDRCGETGLPPGSQVVRTNRCEHGFKAAVGCPDCGK